MNIKDFEQHIDSKILNRGYDYYDNGNIIEIYEQGEDEYTFIIEGREDYEVTVKLDDKGDIVYSYCNCPYNFGPVCKHEVATYFQLFEIFNSKNLSEKITNDIVKRPKIEEILNSLSKDELVNIIIDITKEDSTLKNKIIFKYSKDEGEDGIERCKKLMESIIRKYMTREGYILYRETYGFINDMEILLEKMKDTKDKISALEIGFLLLEELIESFQYADDSGGVIGSLIIEIIDSMEEVIMKSKSLDRSIREKMFEKLLTQVDNRVFEGWEDYRIDIIAICAEFADVKPFRDRLLNKIKSWVDKNNDDQYKKYSSERMLMILYNIIQQYGEQNEAERFIKDNLKFSSFRELLIEKYMEKENYNKVIELALDGEKNDKHFRGLVSKWKELRYVAYKKLLLKQEQEKLAKELFFSGEYEYYKELKELHKGNEEELYNALKQELKSSNGWHRRDIYLKLIVDEKDLEEIMEYVRQNPMAIENYSDMLIDQYEDEVVNIYNNMIMSAADLSNNRKRYQEVCRKIKRYRKIAGDKKANKIIEKLRKLYKRRPAFLDELGKI
ncbi:SWIM zinc finger family protein [Dethiothermospora halolimnae]|uniref:SWIM zinc finger family protein n=1 Tax=Dethiothermospora halolimnae TaxID=3114390 RepID=UPI003CCB8863